MALPVGPVVYAIYINGTQANEFPLDVELRQEWGSHDLFTVRIEVPRTFTGISSYQFWPDNSPVQIIWGRRPDNITSWYGYVNHHTVNGNASSGSKALEIVYTLIGTSKPMNTDRSKTWGQVTGTYIAKTIFGSYGLRSVLTNTDWIFPYEVQANESDFAFLNRMADKLGFRMWVSGSTGYFIDPSVVLTGTSSQGIPSYSLDKRFTQVDTIRQFSSSQGDNLPGATIANRTIFGIDAQTGQAFQAQADSAQPATVTQTFSDWPATDYGTAKNLVQAKQQRSQFWMTATADLFGSTYIYPGKLVFLTGFQLPPVNQGYWIVASADHTLKASGSGIPVNDKYSTGVTLLRNTTTVSPNISSTSSVIPEYSPCQLINGSWVATQATVFYDGVQSI
jgi:phage protein D